MLERGVGRKNGVVRLHYRVGHRRRRVHAELQLGLLAVVRGQALEKECAKTRTRSTAERVEDEETLEARTVVREPADLVHHSVNHLLADGVVATRIC